MMLQILFIILVFISLGLCKHISKSFLHPINFFTILWIIILLFSIILFRDYNWSGFGLIWVMGYIILSQFGSLFASRFKPVDKNNDTRSRNTVFNWKTVLFIIIIGFISFILQLHVAGFSLSSFTNVDSFLDMNSSVAHERYYGSSKTSFLSQFLLLFVYLSTLVGGYSFNYATKKNQKLLSTFGSFLPIIGIMLFSNSKAGFIACSILWLTGWCISYLYLKKEFPKFKIKSIFLSIISIIIFLSILYFVMLLRTGDFSKNMQQIIIKKFGIYALAETMNFDYWLTSTKNFISYGMGLNTYMAFYKAVGLTTRVQGVYSIMNPGFGNVFSSFRGIIMDFGIFFGLLYGFIRGFITQLCINSIIKANKNVCFNMVILTCMYFFNIYSLIISPWVYTSFVLTIITFYIFLLISHRLIKVRG